MKITVGDVTNNKCDVRDYLIWDEEEEKIYVQGEELNTVLIDRSDEWERLNERINKLESFKNSVEYTVDSETLELIINNQDNDKVLSLSETYDEKIYLLQKQVEELETQVENWQKGRYLAVSTIDKERELKKRVQELEELLGANMTEVRILKNAIKRTKMQNKRYQEVIEEIKKTSNDYRAGHLLDIQDSFFVDEIIAIINNLEGEE